jgi:uncharacterized protein YjbI with pentapeptide repeats
MSQIGRLAADSISLESDFVCDCNERFRQACRGEPFYKEHRGKRYCVLHYPGTHKNLEFKEALDRKIAGRNWRFTGVYFPSELSFNNMELTSPVDFRHATFHEHANFSSTVFSARASFANATFSDVSFSGAQFDEESSFASAVFRRPSSFDLAVFKKTTDFHEASFSSETSFAQAHFEATSDFSSCHFRGKANFSTTMFGGEAQFRGSEFEANSNFSSSSFKSDATFTEVRFQRTYFISASFQTARFERASFGAAAEFMASSFGGEVDFVMASLEGPAGFRESIFKKDARFSLAVFRGDASFSKSVIEAGAHFDQVRFQGELAFDLSVLKGDVDFSSARFSDYLTVAVATGSANRFSLNFQYSKIEQPTRVTFQKMTLRPHWLVQANFQQANFVNVTWDFMWISVEVETLVRRGGENTIPHRILSRTYRQLAVNAEENHRYDEASRFRYSAMATRWQEGWFKKPWWRRPKFGIRSSWHRLNQNRLVAWLRGDHLTFLYWLMSGYGERVFRALVALMVIWLGFALLYTCVGFARWDSKPSSETEYQLVRRDEMGQPLPLKSALTYSIGVMSLQKPDPKPATNTAYALVVFETILGPVQAALLALAIRRKFMR